MNKVSIAIDGPAGAGKSTIAKRLANELECTYIDTGAMYRAVGLFCIQSGIDYNLQEEVDRIAEDIQITLKLVDGAQRIYVNGNDVSEAIRTQEVAASASKVATYGKVRAHLVALQQAMEKVQSVVMDGRDIGTVVLPHATLKIFLTASSFERANRRYLEYKEKGMEADLEAIEQEIIARDLQDTTREISPLKKAEDAVEIDTTAMSIEEIVAQIKQLLTSRE